MSEPDVLTLDLARSVPQGIAIQGLTALRTDGVNEYRLFTGDSASLTFRMNRPGFAQLDYQIFTKQHGARSTLLIDGKELTSNLLTQQGSNPLNPGSFLTEGQHTFSIVNYCPVSCTDEFQLYWPRIRLVYGGESSLGTGLNARTLPADDPTTQVRFTGVSAPVFDGVNIGRSIQGKNFQIQWPTGYQALDVNFIFYSPEPFKLDAKVNENLLLSIQDGGGSYLPIRLSLKRSAAIRKVDFELECSAKSSTCAHLYSANVVVIPNTSRLEAVMALIVVPLLVYVIFKWLALEHKDTPSATHHNSVKC